MCILCRQVSDLSLGICQHCLDLLPILQHSCRKCAAPLGESKTCGYCSETAVSFDATHALFLYQPPITKLIWQLKFNHALIHAKLFGDLLTQKILKEYANQSLPGLIVPVPLHKYRLKDRGFNQALEIARPVAKKLKIPLDLSPKRCKSTMPQATLAAKDRTANVKNAFKLKRNYKNMHIAVIDDVITTGSTIQEFCHELKKAGAKRIDVWCCARPVFISANPVR